MAIPTLTPEEFELLKKQQKEQEPVIQKATNAVKKTVQVLSAKTPSFVDSLTLLIISFLYFFFTGLALLLNRQLPKEWLRLSRDLNKGRIGRKIKKDPILTPSSPSQLQENRPKYQVFDLDTHKPMDLRVE